MEAVSGDLGGSRDAVECFGLPFLDARYLDIYD